MTREIVGTFHSHSVALSVDCSTFCKNKHKKSQHRYTRGKVCINGLNSFFLCCCKPVPCSNNSKTLPTGHSPGPTPSLDVSAKVRTVCVLLSLPLASEPGQLFYRGKSCSLPMQTSVLSLLCVFFPPLCSDTVSLRLPACIPRYFRFNADQK